VIRRLDDGSDLHSWTNALKTIHDDRLAGFETVAHHAKTIDDRSQRHAAVLNLVLRSDDVDELLTEIGTNGAVLNQKTAIRGSTRET
jgi:hypothetical protein